jgi:hypothetical protein
MRKEREDGVGSTCGRWNDVPTTSRRRGRAVTTINPTDQHAALVRTRPARHSKL